MPDRLCIFCPAGRGGQTLQRLKKTGEQQLCTLGLLWNEHLSDVLIIWKVDMHSLYIRHPFIWKSGTYSYISVDGHVLVVSSVPFHPTDEWITVKLLSQKLRVSGTSRRAEGLRAPDALCLFSRCGLCFSFSCYNWQSFTPACLCQPWKTPLTHVCAAWCGGHFKSCCVFRILSTETTFILPVYVSMCSQPETQYYYATFEHLTICHRHWNSQYMNLLLGCSLMKYAGNLCLLKVCSFCPDDSRRCKVVGSVRVDN